MSTALIFPPTQNAIQKTLGAQLLVGATASATLSDVTGIQNKKGIMVVDRVDTNGNATASLREYITFTGVSGSTVTGLTRGLAGSTDQTHAVGAVVEFVQDALVIQAIIDGLLQLIDTTGTLDTTKIVDLTTPQTLTNKVLTSPTLSGTPTLDATSSIPFYNDSLSRQALVNGNFDLWQRNTTETRTSNGYGGFVADRWAYTQYTTSGSNPTITYSKQLVASNGVPGAFYCFRISPNSAGTSLSNDSEGLIYQKIENGTRILCGADKTVTVSFWAKSDITNKRIGIKLIQGYGSGGSPSASENLVGNNWTLTSSWTKYTQTFTTNTLSGKSFGTNNDDSLSVQITYQWGSSNQSLVDASSAETYGGSGLIDIAQAQLCSGSIALPFMPRTVAEERNICMRYYEKSYSDGTPTGTTTTTGAEYSPVSDNTVLNGQRYATVTYKVPKRVAVNPTIYPYTTPANTGRVSRPSDGLDLAANSGTIANSNERGFTVFNNSGSTLASDAGAVFYHWSADAEL